MNPHVSIIILNWNGWKDTLACLDSLCKISFENFSIVLLDNGSTDESVVKLTEYLEAKSFFDNQKLTLITNEKNLGFTGGNNKGAEYAMKTFEPDYVLFLNNDTVVENDFLTRLVEVAKSDDKVGSVQPLLLRPGGEVVDSLGIEFRATGPEDKGARTAVRDNDLSKNVEIFGPCCAAALFKSKALKKTGLFNPLFFAIFEDVDLAWRMRLAGYSSILTVNAVVYHKRGVSNRNTWEDRCRSMFKVRFWKDLALIYLKDYPIKRYHSKKNLMMVYLRYFPWGKILRRIFLTPHWFIPYFLGLLFSVVRTGNTNEFVKLTFQSLKKRKEIAKASHMEAIQRQWL